VSSGLGRLLAEKALIRGDRVGGASRSEDALPDLRARYPERLRIVAVDLKDQSSVRAAVDRAFAASGRIDIVVSNAGYGLLGAAEEAGDVQVRDIIDTNLIGSIALIRAALPHLRSQGGGRILQVSSEGGQIAYPAFSLYHATRRLLPSASSSPWWNLGRRGPVSAAISRGPSRSRPMREHPPVRSATRSVALG
jgi:NADP-dependent 3-hydroxy acid dehydrogenase YdfG